MTGGEFDQIVYKNHFFGVARGKEIQEGRRSQACWNKEREKKYLGRKQECSRKMPRCRSNDSQDEINQRLKWMESILWESHLSNVMGVLCKHEVKVTFFKLSLSSVFRVCERILKWYSFYPPRKKTGLEKLMASSLFGDLAALAHSVSESKTLVLSLYLLKWYT